MSFLKKISDRGASLIIVLASLALLMILVIGFLASVGTEFQSSKMYANGSSLKLLAQSSVNLVIGQLRVATSNGALCWASQPGMIRTYDTTGAAAGYYKLYSDSSMQGTGIFDHTLDENKVPPLWFNQKGVYVDLNQPVTVNNVNYFPILAGDASDLITYTPPFDNTGSGAEPVRAMKPLTGTVPDVSGFWLNKNTPVDSTSPNKAPMPVKWLYVLQDGKIAVPDSALSGTDVTFTNSRAKPSNSNPIVGRMAYWTDDETAKVNINTASEGTFWDTPRSYTEQDYYLATRQPVQGEYQRYPGHPASVSLSAVLGLPNANAAWTPTSPVSHEEVYPLTPATKAGGSMGGTADTSAGMGLGLFNSVTRLYSNVDELMFKTNLVTTANGKVRDQNSTNLSGVYVAALDPNALRKSRFFLTANSQAPDVNVFNLPRVSMWPITIAPTMPAFDKLISYCTTINNNIFYFQRQFPNHPTSDLPAAGTAAGLGRNRQLLEYLRRVTDRPIPGFGTGKFSQKYSSGDIDQILTEMFDYIRSTNLQDSSANATKYAVSFDNTSSSYNYQGGRGQVVPIVDENITVTDSEGGTSHPRGFGRFPTLQQAALIFIGVRDKTPDGSYVPATTNDASGVGTVYTKFSVIAPTDIGVQRVQAGLFLQTFDPSQGAAVTFPWYEIEVKGADDLKWSNVEAGDGVSMGFPTPAVITKPYSQTVLGSVAGGQNDFRIYTYNRGSGTRKYPLISPPTGAIDPVTLGPKTSPDMKDFIYFKGGNITVEIYALKSDGINRVTPGNPQQTFKLKFPSANIPVPSTIVDTTDWSHYDSGQNFRSFYTSGGLKGRLDFNKATSWISTNDSIRALVATPGDLRLIAARTNVQETFFQKLPNYGQAIRMSHMLRFGYNFPVWGSSGSKLVNASYSRYFDTYLVNDSWLSGSDGNFGPLLQHVSSASPQRTKDPSVVPSLSGVSQLSNISPDWDNGVGNLHDGPFINKADEGDAGSGSLKPYMDLDYGESLPGVTFFSPNRMIPSSGMFGSLPTGVWANKPWQTLLFRPGPANHFGLGTQIGGVTYPPKPPYSTPPDHLMMDLFTMPVVEPYAISTPLATAGRINMNYQIVPFTYIHRDTALRAAMKAQMITAIPVAVSSSAGANPPSYKNSINPNGVPNGVNAPSKSTLRFPLNYDAILGQFQARFDSKDIFRSASEICTVDLVPVLPSAGPTLPPTRSSMDNWWASTSGTTGRAVTGDNVKERPYTNLYPLLTTKSNTFTVHFRVQLLKQLPRSNMAVWKEGTDQVLSQYRGSQIIERYIDPKDSIPDYATANLDTVKPLNEYYKFRVVSTQQFAP